MERVVKAICEKGILKPLEKLNLREDERVRMEIKKEIFGILRDWNIDSQKLKEELRGVFK